MGLYEPLHQHYGYPQAPCMLDLGRSPQLLWVHGYISPVMSRKHFSAHLHVFQLLSHPPFSHSSLSFGGTEDDEVVLLRAEYSADTYSQCFDHWCVSTPTLPRSKPKISWLRLRAVITDLMVGLAWCFHISPRSKVIHLQSFHSESGFGWSNSQPLLSRWQSYWNTNES